MVKALRQTVLFLCAVVATTWIGRTEAFATPPSSHRRTENHLNVPKVSSVLHERKWNFNEGQGPFGLKKNAEIWNGRVAQVCSVSTGLQCGL